MAVNGVTSSVPAPDVAALLASLSQTFVSRAVNLADLASPATARTNLGLASSATMTPAQLAADSSFKNAFASKASALPRLIHGTVPVGWPSDFSYSGSGNAGGATAVTSRSKHTIITDCSDLRFVWQGANAAEAAMTNNFTVKFAVEVVGVNVYAGYFAGQRTVTVEPWQTVISDPIPLDLRAGDVIYVRTYTTVADNTKVWPLGRSMDIDGTEGRVTGSDLADSGTITGGTILSNPPHQILGVPRVPQTVTVGVVGASGITGQGDQTSTGWYNGWLRRALGSTTPSQWVSVPGDTAQAFQVYSYRARMPILAGSTHYVCQYGTGDVLNGSRTAAQCQADLIRIWRALATRGGKVAQVALNPKTTSSDGWTTTGGQAAADAGAETHRGTVNAWLRDGAPINGSIFAAVATGDQSGTTIRQGATLHPLTRLLDLNPTIETALGSGIWKAGYTADGLHPSTTGAIAIAAALAADLTAFLAL